jgi:hypothetical protein
VHATAGSDDLMDVVQDLYSGLDIADVQIIQSLLFSGITNNLYNKDKSAKSLVYVGHSLGGGLAAANAMKYNHQAVTYNAMGISVKWQKLYGMNYNPTINAYIIKGEALNAMQITKANGIKHYIQPKGTKAQSFGKFVKNTELEWYENYHSKYGIYLFNKSVDNHSMNHFLKYDF